MKKIITITLILFSAIAFSQKCKYETNEIDEFTKKEVKIVKEKQLTKVGLGLGDYIRFDARSMDGNKFIRLLIAGTSSFHIDKDAEILFLTDNGNVITLHATESITASGIYQKSTNTSHWSANVLLHLTDENFNKLIDSNIKKVRWHTSNGFREKEVKSKHKAYLAESLKCLK